MNKIMLSLRNLVDGFRVQKPKVRAGARARDKRRAIREFYNTAPVVMGH